MHKDLDARGLACPAPVLLVKETLESQDVESLSVIVDNDAARENVSRFLQSRGYTPTVTAQGADFQITASRSADAGVAPVASTVRSPGDEAKKIMVLVSSPTMGKGDDTLGSKLMVNYLKTLKELGDDLWRLVFINGGVSLTTADSPVIAELKGYEAEGLLILVCGTCLEHFKLMDAKQVGQTTNMLDIVTAMQLADSVITIS